MEEPQHDYGRALSVDAEAIGQPGQRRFRLMVRSNNDNAAIWMEKQQLAEIGTWLEETCGQLDADHPTGDADEEPSPFGAIFGLDFNARQIGLGYVEDRDLFAFQAFADAANADVPTFRCFLTRGQARVLSRTIARVVAAGRPICPLCEAPMDPAGHVCPKQNGHHPVATA